MSLRVPMAVVTEPGKVVLQERELPEMGQEDVTIRVKTVTLCGSDLHIFKGKHPAVDLPIPVGHEVCGEIVATGGSVSSLHVGDRIAVEPVITCGRCHYCMRGLYHLCTQISFQYRRGQGGLATHLVIPEQWAHKLPEAVDDEEGALIEPLSVALHAVRKSSLQPGGSSAVFGAGAIGLLIVQVARATGGGKIFAIDIDPFRLEYALRLGASHALNNLDEPVVDFIREQTDDLGADRVFEAAGLEVTLLQSLESVRKGGNVIVIGLFEKAEVRIPANVFVQKEISLSGSQGYQWDFPIAINLAASGRINLKDMITHRFELSQVQDAFDVLTNPQEKVVKVLIRLDGVRP
jgi:2-desacetyl-2-hydroxyethyl bacteriochlorophyllide A dehydrogenase